MLISEFTAFPKAFSLVIYVICRKSTTNLTSAVIYVAWYLLAGILLSGNDYSRGTQRKCSTKYLFLWSLRLASKNKIVQGQHPANLSHCIFEQIEVMIIYPRRKNCSQHWYWKINVVAVLWLSIKSIVFYQTYRDDQTKGIRIK